MDTISSRNPDGTVEFPQIGPNVIPVRYHMYWAGSDRDGAVAGFFWAVTETTSNVEAGGFPPPIPAPKPSDYHFTTKTDTTFVFNVTENAPDRQHGFFIYSVDNQGKVDPTPARFIFIAIDKFPPRPVIEYAKATGTIVHVEPGGSLRYETLEYFVNDTLPPPQRSYPPTDTVPAGSRLDFRWHGEITLAGTYVTKYRYRLDEPTFVDADSSTHTVSYNTGEPGTPPTSTGTKVFTLRAIDQAGGAGETTRRFIMNFSPDTWWSGPDPNGFPVDADRDGRSWDVAPNWISFPGIPNTYFGPDSMRDRPALRPEHRTFYEIWKDRIWARSQNDTVHMNSWVVLWNGGYDKDSKYLVKADTTDPYLHDPSGGVITAPVVTRDGVVGSPIGFRSRVVVRTDPFGQPTNSAQTTTYPIYDPASVFRAPHIGAYWRMFLSGKAYALARAEDGDNALDGQVDNPVTLADLVDGGGGTTDERRIRDQKILTFYVNKAPVLRTNDPSFVPRAFQNFTTVPWAFNLIATDVDPFDNTNSPPAGGPTGSVVLRYKVTLAGRTTDGRDTTWTYSAESPYFYTARINVIPPCFFASGQIRVTIELCDCRECETVQGQGRCITQTIVVNHTRQASCTTPSETSENVARPGSDPPDRSQ